ncbi:hypothetical protein WJ972_04015 [Achromobacter insuavis]
MLVRPVMAPAARAAGHALFVILAVLLFLHWLPGFHNPLVIPRAALTPDAVPFSMYLNLDKPLVAFWVVLAAAPAMAGANARHAHRGAGRVRGRHRGLPRAGAGATGGGVGAEMARLGLALADQ